MKKFFAILLLTSTLVAWNTVPVIAQGQPEAAENRGGSSALNGATAKERKNKINDRVTEKKEEVNERRSEIKARIEEKKATVNQDRCEKRQANIQRVIKNMNQNAPRILERFNGAYVNVLLYIEENNVAVDNLEELTTAVDEKLAQATADVESIQEYEFTLDCNISGVGEQLVAAKESGAAARESLKAYRSALKDLIVATKVVAQETEVADDNQTDTEQEQ